MKLMKLRRDYMCTTCCRPVAAGASAYWNAVDKTVHCAGCYETTAVTTSPTPVDDSVSARLPSKGIVAAADSPAGLLAIGTPDIAGRSAAKEYEKRSARERARAEKKISEDAAWRVEIKERRPLLGRIAAAVTPRPTVGTESHATKAWITGAQGELRVAEILAEVSQIEVLHDRLVPGRGAANIDHIVVAAAGVFVIDAKKYKGTLEVREKGTIFRSNPRLYVGGRDRTMLTDGVRGQVDAVSSVLAADWSQVPIRGVLCFVGCDWTRQTEKHLNDVAVVWPKGLPKLVSVAGPYGPQAEAIATQLRRALKKPN